MGIRVQDLFDPGILRKKLDLVLREKNQVLTKVYNRRGIDPEACAAEYEQYAERLRPYVADTGLALGRALDQGQVVLLEVGDGHHARRGPRHIPVRDLLVPHRGRRLRRIRHRADPDLGRDRHRQGLHDAGRRGPVPHRVARRDRRVVAQERRGVRRDHRQAAPASVVNAVIARYATRVNGITGYFLTKLDVLSGLDQVPVCVAYDVDGQRYDEIPVTQTEFHHAVPVYENFDGWAEDISKARTLDELSRTPGPTLRPSRT